VQAEAAALQFLE